MPVIDLINRLLGPVDKLLISKLITRWTEKIWFHAAHLLDTDSLDAQQEWIRQIEKEALQSGKFTLLSRSQTTKDATISFTKCAHKDVADSSTTRRGQQP